jgi:hypothetical protein
VLLSSEDEPGQWQKHRQLEKSLFFYNGSGLAIPPPKIS